MTVHTSTVVSLSLAVICPFLRVRITGVSFTFRNRQRKRHVSDRSVCDVGDHHEHERFRVSVIPTQLQTELTSTIDEGHLLYPAYQPHRTSKWPTSSKCLLLNLGFGAVEEPIHAWKVRAVL
ncbi:hypothetical protein BC826DRAFT_734555 [Russula brevipes]|nr:hypothetical protein BC826DRAFT_734555 [Russula brevipes]